MCREKNGSDVGHLGRVQNHRDGRLAKHLSVPAGAIHLQMKGPKLTMWIGWEARVHI
jgi:hypothetical protein